MQSPRSQQARARKGLVSALVVAALLAASVPTASAQEGHDAVCATNQAPDTPVRESRFFCEPLESTAFVQFDQFVEGLQVLEGAYPDWIEVRQIGESVLGRPIYFVEVTNELSEKAREEKLQIGYSASIHANEAAGREGMVRVIEDLAAAKGPYGADLQPILDDVILNVWFPNPDSWASGDYFDADSIGGLHNPLLCDSPAQCIGYARANVNGFDLNRQFPNPGWIQPDHEPMSQPEAQSVVQELRYSGNHSNLVAGADLHGMINSPNMIRSIIPNQDYDLRRMVLIVDQLRTIQERVAANPAFAEWQAGATLTDLLTQDGVDYPTVPVPVLGGQNTAPEALLSKPMEWGARWDMIGYTDTGFTSDYMTLSPRSPTGGMGAVGTIVEFAYSHMVPDNKYVAKLTDMHVAGVREIVRTQLEMAGRLESPVLAGTGPVAFIDDGTVVSSRDDPNAYQAPDGKDFDLTDPEARFDFNQVPYDVTNIRFWHDLARFSADPVEPLAPGQVTAAALADYEHLAITDQAIDALADKEVAAIHAWVEDGGSLLLTDGALRFLDRAGITQDGAKQLCVYVGHSDLQDMAHPLLEGVDWGARVTGEASAVGFKADRGDGDANYPQWGITEAAFEGLGGDIVGTTQGQGAGDTCENQSDEALVTLGRVPVGTGTIDLIGGALPMPTQAYDHRFGLADYSVSALTYWVVANSLGGQIEWQPIDAPFVPSYDYDPLYGSAAPQDQGTEDADTPGVGLVAALLLVAAATVALRGRRR